MFLKLVYIIGWFLFRRKGRRMSFQESYLVEYDFWREISISLDKINSIIVQISFKTLHKFRNLQYCFMKKYDQYPSGIVV